MAKKIVKSSSESAAPAPAGAAQAHADDILASIASAGANPALNTADVSATQLEELDSTDWNVPPYTSFETKK